MSTLIVAPNWIGDALMAQPLLTLIKRSDPAERIVALAPDWVAPVLYAMPEIDAVVGTSLAHGTLQWAERRALARQLAVERFARAFVLPNSFKSALIPWLARIPQRIGYLGEARYRLVNHCVSRPNASLTMAAQYARLGTAIGLRIPPVLPQPSLRVAAAEVEAALARFELAPASARALIALCPGAEFGPAKRWPVAHFAALARAMHRDDRQAQIVLLGGPGDDAIAAAIIDSSIAATPANETDSVRRALRNLAGKTTLAEAIALLAAATAVVSNDSGLMHVAAALKRPQVALFGSSDPRHTPPLSERAQVLWLHLDCSPCFQRTCPLGHLNCLNGIAPERVFEALQAQPKSSARDGGIIDTPILSSTAAPAAA